MPLEFLLDRFDELSATGALLEGLPVAGKRLPLAGLPGSSPALLVAVLARRLPQRLFAVVTATPADAERWLADLQQLVGERAVLYPQREGLGADEPHVEIAGERIETIAALLSGRARVVVTTARASAERTGVPRVLEASRLELATGDRSPVVGLTDVAQRLADMGYERVPGVTEVGQFSVRGGILDVYGFGMAAPARVEWWGDEIVSLRGFDLDTQRSAEPIDRVSVLPIRTGEGWGKRDEGWVRTSLLDLLPADTLLVVDQEAAVEREVERAWADAAHHLDVARRLGEEPSPREELLLDPAAWRARLA
ncbi:MAG: hypothetical protein DMD68_09920, partial [Gemmatimonadetes bacterium]